ncbi:NAD(P)/FAD-dependent oxidoreductase [Actinomadura graeca]|uniref:NAD(P)/FAD-dependent oxidoreductase n=1 Tax=Actinomadura graeca TaxID=2750812 RepID=A0ABX8QYU6_9ACTN|nr:NAD(P)/FAD-dependent oxidoreductase [Actinomadura graeca]QXJ23793.1 NAD(P)/FAD-dependent oxidoreductase [Actinomadura graeca]
MVTEHLDVVVVGAGLSGVGMACQLRRQRPDLSFVVLEARDELGGTWSLFRFPGVRSDSDMFTLGYRFRPWTSAETMPDGASILRYLRETAEEFGVTGRIRLRRRVVRARWESARARWTLDVEVVGEDGAPVRTVEMTCWFLLMCSGYYSYEEGYTPELPGIARFEGTVVHPQAWHDGVAYRGKRVVVIGSGATAVTMVPAIAREAGQVTMLQRSPSYVLPVPSTDVLVAKLPRSIAYRVVRWKNIVQMMLVFQVSRWFPKTVRGLLRRMAVAALPPGFEVDVHFNPRYRPWDQRLCMAPDGDLFTAIRDGRASVITGRIAGFTKDGIELRSGEVLPADLVVTATGLNMRLFGGVRVVVDGEEVAVPSTLTYKGVMFAGVPNLVYAMGYTNASWTLRVELIARYLFRLLRHMDARGHRVAVPVNTDASVTEEPFVDLAAGYVRRVLHELPRQGSRAPWRLPMNYVVDSLVLRFGRVDDAAMTFRGGSGQRARRASMGSRPWK